MSHYILVKAGGERWTRVIRPAGKYNLLDRSGYIEHDQDLYVDMKEVAAKDGADIRWEFAGYYYNHSRPVAGGRVRQWFRRVFQRELVPVLEMHP